MYRKLEFDRTRNYIEVFEMIFDGILHNELNILCYEQYLGI